MFRGKAQNPFGLDQARDDHEHLILNIIHRFVILLLRALLMEENRVVSHSDVPDQLADNFLSCTLINDIF